jgi:hypothetical protein
MTLSPVAHTVEYFLQAQQQRETINDQRHASSTSKPTSNNGGVNVKISVNGKVARDSKARYGGDKGTSSVGGAKWGTIQGYDRCWDIKITKGDSVVVESTYDLAKHRLRPGVVDHTMGAEAMALVGVVLAERV